MRDTKKYLSLPYNPALKERAKALRRAGNLSEVLLWNQLKRKQFFGLDFDRQKIIGNYIVDFYCAQQQVVLEVDGSSHDNKIDYDAQRDAFLIGLDLTVIHLRDSDVKKNLSGVIDFLRNHPAFTTPPFQGTPPSEGKLGRNSPPMEGWQA
jgi:very-short-patch-repair endonuclease